MFCFSLDTKSNGRHVGTVMDKTLTPQSIECRNQNGLPKKRTTPENNFQNE